MARIGNACGVAGLMGNLYAESGLRPNKLQNTYNTKLGMTDAEYTAAMDSGQYTNFVHDGAGYGLAQWTHWSRKEKLLAFAKARGKSIGDWDMQLGFLMEELSSYPSVLRTLKNADSVKAASDAALTGYERPTNQSDSAKTKRAAYAQQYDDQYAGNDGAENGGEDDGTMMDKAQKVMDIALAEVGYLEKASNASLDDKTGNAGDKNKTKYARDLDALGFYNGRKQGVAWCDVFVDWCFVQAYGLDAALKLTFQPLGKNNCGAGCKYSRQYYKSHGRLYDTPQAGDQVFFYPASGIGGAEIAHTGLVYAVDGTYVYTVEGNTSGASGVIANGGVCKKKYKHSYERFAGFGRPNWGAEDEAPETSVAPATTETEAAEIMVYRLGDRVLRNVSPKMRGDDVKELQIRLNALGFDCGKADGIFGSNTEKGVKAFQTAAKIEVDGKFGTESFKALEHFKNDSAPEVPDTSTEANADYIVQKGDTLWGISKKFLGGGNLYPKIMEVNGLKSAMIRPGMVLKIPDERVK